MKRLTRIATIWRKELMDTLRDRRTLIAMVLVPMVLYPAMILGSLQGFELQISRLKQEEYRIAVPGPHIAAWLRDLIDKDPARRPGAERRPAEELVELDRRGELPAEEPASRPTRDRSAAEAAREDVRRQPPPYAIVIVPDTDSVRQMVIRGETHIGILVNGDLPTADSAGSTHVTVLMDQTDIRSQIAAAGLESIFDRAAEALLAQRLRRLELEPEFVRPIELREESTASPEKVGGSILGQIVPLILIIMTITGAIYPAIDLTAGERERGTLETLMVAPVPTVDLIAGKFLVVALIGMLSAALNLLSIGGTIWLGGLGDLLTRGDTVVIPLGALPWVLLVLIPLAVMFSALLLAVCSFARSFKEAQNYVMPVMVAAMIPAIIGVLPGTRLEGPLLIMPVTNIVVLTRDLFTGRFDWFHILWVTLSTTLYAGAAVAVAARLFGQEAVLFADSGSVKTLFQRRFFRPADTPTAAQALLLLAVVFSAMFFTQQQLLRLSGGVGTLSYWVGIAGSMLVFFLLLPLATCAYLRIRVRTTFPLHKPSMAGWLAGVCFGLSTWILVQAWLVYQQRWLPMPQAMEQALERMVGQLNQTPPLVMLFFLALVPAICEEFFFRGFALSGLCRGLGKLGAVLVVALAFGVFHHSVHRLIPTAALGLLFAVLVVKHRSLWPAMLAHFLHNGLSGMSTRDDALKPLLATVGFRPDDAGLPPASWTAAAAAVLLLGLALCFFAPGQRKSLEPPPPIADDRSGDAV